jgi:hypothetical protein
MISAALRRLLSEKREQGLKPLAYYLHKMMQVVMQ